MASLADFAALSLDVAFDAGASPDVRAKAKEMFLQRMKDLEADVAAKAAAIEDLTLERDEAVAECDVRADDFEELDDEHDELYQEHEALKNDMATQGFVLELLGLPITKGDDYDALNLDVVFDWKGSLTAAGEDIADKIAGVEAPAAGGSVPVRNMPKARTADSTILYEVGATSDDGSIALTMLAEFGTQKDAFADLLKRCGFAKPADEKFEAMLVAWRRKNQRAAKNEDPKAFVVPYARKGKTVISDEPVVCDKRFVVASTWKISDRFNIV